MEAVPLAATSWANNVSKPAWHVSNMIANVPGLGGASMKNGRRADAPGYPTFCFE